MTYAEKLKDPRWQRIRLLVFQRDGFKCRICGNSAMELHAHHTIYDRELEPWEGNPDWIITLCTACHSNIENLIKMVRAYACNARAIEIFEKAVKDVEAQ